MILHLDYETRSAADLPKVGLDVYAKDKSTDIMCAAYAFDDEPVELWLPGHHLDQRLIRHIETGGEVHAHNAAFERELTNNVGQKYGWPFLTNDQLVCTMAMSYAMALPGALGGVAPALGIDQQKDLVGGRLMRQYCQPKEILPDGRIVWWDNPEDLKKIYDYCRQDVVVEREIGKRLLMLSPFERKVWQLDQKINSNGIAVDLPAVTAAIEIMDIEKFRLMKEIQDVSGNKIATCNAIKQIRDYMASKGIETEALAKGDVTDLLSRPLPPNVQRILELRQEAGKASTAKLDAMALGAGSDRRIRGTFQYSGANTRRWAGRRIQLQNLPRPKLSPSLCERILHSIATREIDASGIDAIFGPPLSIISNCLRGFLTAGPGQDLAACDFSAIEARVIAWLAGQESALAIFRGDGKIYEHAAASIFRKSVGDITDSERQVGKVAVLALGYQGGVGAFQTMARGYGVKLAPAFGALWDVATPDQRAWASERFESEKENYEISREEFIASDLTKVFWRLANPQIVKFWADLEESAIWAVTHPTLTATCGKVKFKTKGSFLWCGLPGGGVMCYPYAQVKSSKDKWGRVKDRLSYMSEDGASKKWMRFGTYGGSIAENVTQAVARDLLAEAMLRLDSANYKIVAHVHDEVVCEVPAGADSLAEITRIMSEVPKWAEGMPIKAAGWQGFRYRK